MSTKTKSRYRNLIILFVFYVIFWIILTAIMRVIIFPEGNPLALTRFIMFDDILTELFLVFVILIPISGIIGTIIGGYILSPIVLALHKLFYRSKKYYGIQYESEDKKIKLLTSGFYPVLMAVNLAFIFSTPEVTFAVLEPDVTNVLVNVVKNPFFVRFLTQTILLIFTFGASTVFFSPVWLLKDSGVVFTTKDRVESSNETLLIKSIGEWFQTLLKGYAGIGVLFTYILVIYDFIIVFIANLGTIINIVNIPNLFLWLGLPFYLLFSMIPAVIIHDGLRKRRLSYVRKFAHKIGIRDLAIVSFELRQQEERS